MQVALANDILARVIARNPDPIGQRTGAVRERGAGRARGRRRGRSAPAAGRAQPRPPTAGQAIRQQDQDFQQPQQYFDLQQVEPGPASRYIPHAERMERKEEAAAANRPGLLLGYLASQAVPLPQQLCQHCNVRHAVVACRSCSAFRTLLHCGSCDQTLHPHAHTHSRHSWSDGYWQPLQAHENISDDNQELLQGEHAPVLCSDSHLADRTPAAVG